MHRTRVAEQPRVGNAGPLIRLLILVTYRHVGADNDPEMRRVKYIPVLPNWPKSVHMTSSPSLVWRFTVAVEREARFRTCSWASGLQNGKTF